MTRYLFKENEYRFDGYFPDQKHKGCLIYFSGLPISSKVALVIEKIVQRGIVVLVPQYRGTFDSEGLFSFQNASEDVSRFMKIVSKKKFSELYYGKVLSISKSVPVAVLGCSFGSLAVTASDIYDNYSSIHLSPFLVTHKDDLSEDEYFQRIDLITKNIALIRSAFGNTYRVADYDLLLKNLLGSNSLSVKKIVGNFNASSARSLFIHGKNDFVVNIDNTRLLQKLNTNPGNNFHYHEGGHSPSTLNNQTIDVITEFVIRK